MIRSATAKLGFNIGAVSMRLWSLNRWLRYTGFRVFVEVGDDTYTAIGLRWYGLPGSEGWSRIEPAAETKT